MIEKNVDLRCSNSYCLEASAEFFYSYHDERELSEVLFWASEKGLPVHVLGGGSNILFSKNRIAGLVIKMDNRFIDIKSDRVVTGSGADSSMLSIASLGAGLSGAEFLYGLPGTVGGAVFMNARAYDRSVSDILVNARAMDMKGGIRVLKNGELAFSYKDSLFQHQRMIILSAEFRLLQGDRAEIGRLMDSAIRGRREKGHFDFPSCGSVFKNPYDLGVPAGRIIEELGLKGNSCGGAKIFDRHGNFIVNTGDASGSDILALIDLIKKTVKKEKDYDLETEVEIW